MLLRRYIDVEWHVQIQLVFCCFKIASLNNLTIVRKIYFCRRSQISILIENDN